MRRHLDFASLHKRADDPRNIKLSLDREINTAGDIIHKLRNGVLWHKPGEFGKSVNQFAEVLDPVE